MTYELRARRIGAGAGTDGKNLYEAAVPHKREWCFRCSSDRPKFGGKFLGGNARRIPGIVPRFVCADCLAKAEAKKEAAA